MVRGKMLSRFADLVDDVTIELGARRGRSTLMIAAIGLSAGSLITSVGIAQTASRQIGSELASSTLDRVVVSLSAPPESESQTSLTRLLNGFPHDAEDRVDSLNMVTASGRRLDVDGFGTASVHRLAGEGGVAMTSEVEAPVVGLTSGYLAAADVSVEPGREWSLDEDYPIAFLGSQAAERLYVPDGDDIAGTAIWINQTRYEFGGLITSSGTADLSASVVVPYSRAVVMVGTDAPATMLVRVEPGAGPPVARALKAALRPDDPARLDIAPVADLRQIRVGVETQMGRLVGGIGAVLLALAALLIANSMVVSVVSRTGEIGLRRALGASRSGVARVFLSEGALLGFVGGCVGSCVGGTAVVATAALNNWSPTLSPLVLLLSPALGLGVGLVAAAYPALRASRIEAADALRSD